MYRTLGRVLNALCVFMVDFVLAGALFFQFVLQEMPCPLCLLQRIAFIGLAIGPMLNVRFGVRAGHYGISLLSAVYGMAVSGRQVFLHIIPGTGGYGGTVLGLHLYTWAFIFFITSIVIIGIFLFYHDNFLEERDIVYSDGLTKLVFIITALIVLINIISTFFECGMGQCPDNPTHYKILP
ncbi:disulfide bond formation protein B [Desulfovibrio inopinatus]|uniref:disulfide bond formation protein B n=1 Tax=Desulfovibrio inopinatus TaxID=102109 RepID=UPI000413E3D7|nr:disulfide bond formation protein B [Desulfovibrio inopinatus]